jgi:hypothetical protein
MRKKLSPFFAGLIALTTVASGSAFIATSTSAAPKSIPFDFSSCVENNRSASVVLLMDESQSIYGSGSKQASDPNHLRVAGAQILVANLQQAANTYNSEIKVTLAGFGDKFVTRSSGDNGWVSLQPNKPADGQRQLIELAKDFAELPADGNSRETDTYSALYGAQEAFRSVGGTSPCKLLVFFKDGKDFQYFNPTDTQPVEGSDEINALLSVGDSKSTQEATALAQTEICRAGGLVDGLRQDGVNLLGVGLQSDGGSADWGNFRSIIEGGASADCEGGSVASKGKLILAVTPDDLPFKFADILRPCPNGDCSIPQVITSFKMKSALSSVTLTTSGIADDFDKYSITPPVSCRNGAEQKFDKNLESSNGQFGQGVTWQALWFGKQTVQILLKNVDENDISCWEGTWKVNTGTAKSKLDFDADLEAVPVFEDKNLFLVPGDPAKTFKIDIQHPSDESNSSIPLSSFSADVSMTVNGWLEDSSGKNVYTLFPGTNGVTREELIGIQEISVPEDFPLGDYRMVLELSIGVEGFTWPLRPIKTERNIEIREQIATPKFVTDVAFGEIEGSTPKVATVKIDGSKDADFKVSFDDDLTSIQVIQGPQGLSYVVSNPNEQEVIIPKDAVGVELKIAIAPNLEGEVKKQGPLAGNLSIAMIPVGSESEGSQAVTTKFSASQRASVSVGFAAITLLLLMLIGAAISFFTYKLVVSLISRFIRPLDADMMGLEAKSISVRFLEGEILDENSVREQVRDSSGWQPVTVAPSRKTVDLGPHEFRAKSVGWKLSSEGRGIISGGNYEGFSASSNSEPEIKLNLTTPWVFFVEKEALSDLENGATGTLLYIRNSETSSDKRVDDVEEFFYNFSSFEPSKGVKQSTGQREDLLVPDLEYQVEAEPKAAKKNFFGTLSKKKQKNIPPAREPELPASDSTDW